MAKGDQEAFRMQVVSAARLFKRSWVDMAEALSTVRERALYERWGYETLHGYALDELQIKRSTCDKLTGSFSAMREHVPHVLGWDGVAQPMPEIDAVDYFAKAVDPRPRRDGEDAPPPPDDEVVAQLKQAIFEEHASAPSLRRRFNPLLRPRDEEQQRHEHLSRVRASARRLEALVGELDGLSEARVEEVTRCVESLCEELDHLDEA